MFAISEYVGGASLKASMSALNFVNHDGIANLNNEVVELNTRLKKFVHVTISVLF